MAEPMWFSTSSVASSARCASSTMTATGAPFPGCKQQPAHRADHLLAGDWRLRPPPAAKPARRRRPCPYCQAPRLRSDRGRAPGPARRHGPAARRGRCPPSPGRRSPSSPSPAPSVPAPGRTRISRCPRGPGQPDSRRAPLAAARWPSPARAGGRRRPVRRPPESRHALVIDGAGLGARRDAQLAPQRATQAPVPADRGRAAPRRQLAPHQLAVGRLVGRVDLDQPVPVAAASQQLEHGTAAPPAGSEPNPRSAPPAAALPCRGRGRPRPRSARRRSRWRPRGTARTCPPRSTTASWAARGRRAWWAALRRFAAPASASRWGHNASITSSRVQPAIVGQGQELDELGGTPAGPRLRRDLLLVDEGSEAPKQFEADRALLALVKPSPGQPISGTFWEHPILDPPRRR